MFMFQVRTDSASAQESVSTEDSAMMDTESLRLEEKLQSFQNELNDHTGKHLYTGFPTCPVAPR